MNESGLLTRSRFRYNLKSSILQSLYGAVDLFVAGQYCPAESVAAVSTGTQAAQIVTSLVTGLTLGSTIFRISDRNFFGNNFANNLGYLGMITPVVSGIMACYTIVYILYEGRKYGAKGMIKSNRNTDSGERKMNKSELFVKK